VGGKPRKPAGPSRGAGEPKPKRRGGGRSTQHRTPVVALVEREGGRSVAKPTIDAPHKLYRLSCVRTLIRAPR
jgi:hypothetical protein